MITLAKCKKILNKEGINYTNEEMEIIRDFPYQMAELDYQIFKENKKEKILFEQLPFPTYQEKDIDEKTFVVFEHFKNNYSLAS